LMLIFLGTSSWMCRSSPTCELPLQSELSLAPDNVTQVRSVGIETQSLLDPVSGRTQAERRDVEELKAQLAALQAQVVTPTRSACSLGRSRGPPMACSQIRGNLETISFLRGRYTSFAIIFASSQPTEAKSTLAYISDSPSSSVPFWVAEDAGIFKKHGLDVDMLFIKRQHAWNSEPYRGRSYFTVAVGTSAINGRLAGGNIRIISSLVDTLLYYIRPTDHAETYARAGTADTRGRLSSL